MSAYTALGDSYAAGVGSGDSAGSCGRSVEGYPVLVASALDVGLDYEACLGATIGEVRKDQLHGLGDDSEYVSITVGGNDLHFTDVMTEFALPAWMADDSVLDESLRILHDELPGRYDDLLAEVHDRAPRARIIVAGYPRLFNGVDCSLFTFFSEDEMARLNDAADELAEVTAESCRKAGVEFVDVRDAFEGHAICDEEAWIHDAVWPLEESFHPTAAGYTEYGRLVAAALGASRSRIREGQQAVSRQAAAAKRAREAAMARQVKVTEPAMGEGGWPIPTVCGAGRTTPASCFRMPDLTSRRSLEGASRHGLDPDEVALLGLRLKSPAGDRWAMQRVHELDRQVREFG